MKTFERYPKILIVLSDEGDDKVIAEMECGSWSVAEINLEELKHIWETKIKLENEAEDNLETENYDGRDNKNEDNNVEAEN